MKQVRLEDLVSSAGSKAGQTVQLPVYSVTKHEGFVPSLEYFKKQVFSRDLSSYKRVEPGDFAYATIHLDEGSIGIAPEAGLISPMYTVFRVNESLVDPRYLLRFLKSPPALARYPQLGRGAVHRRQSISLKALGQLAIPLPAITEQRRITAILDQADSIRAKRRQVLAHLDSLARSIFHDMFDEPTGQSWDSAPLGEVVGQIDNGSSPNCETRPATLDEWGVLKLGAVTYGDFRPHENKAFTGSAAPLQKNEVHQGDVLMTRKNTRDLVGAVAVVGEVRPRLLLPDLIFRLHLDPTKLNAHYFQARMMSLRTRTEVRRLASGSAASMPNISKARLRTLPVEMPPLRLQTRFAELVNEIELRRNSALLALEQTEALFTSLQSRAFKGEL